MGRFPPLFRTGQVYFTNDPAQVQYPLWGPAEKISVFARFFPGILPRPARRNGIHSCAARPERRGTLRRFSRRPAPDPVG